MERIGWTALLLIVSGLLYLVTLRLTGIRYTSCSSHHQPVNVMQFVFGRHAEFRSPHVLTIGNFDGVHVGHQRVIHQAQQVAKSYNFR